MKSIGLVFTLLIVVVLTGCSGPSITWTMENVSYDSVSRSVTLRIASTSMSGTVDHGLATITGNPTLTLSTGSRDRKLAMYFVATPKCLAILLPPFGSSPDAMQPLLWPLLQNGCSCIIADHSYDADLDPSITQFTNETMSSIPFALDTSNHVFPASYASLPIALYGASYGTMVAAELVHDSAFARRVSSVVLEAPIVDVGATWKKFGTRLPTPFKELPADVLGLGATTIATSIAPTTIHVVAGRRDAFYDGIDLDSAFAALPLRNRRFIDTDQHHFRAGVKDDAAMWTSINKWIADQLCR
ncbi:MAG: hypothetical protein JSS89_05365 [Bacteroidetes bacterium]|nr:hypothetical protein [Bacteroidota bacterium]